MPAELRWRCNPGPQREFLFGRLGRVREVLYGGAKGGGKSAAIGPKAYLHIAANPGVARVLILRETFDDLTDLMDKMRPQCEAQGAAWHEQKRTWTFPCGAKIRFGYVKGKSQSATKRNPYWGQEYTLIVVDEVTRCIASEVEYLELLGSLRNAHGVAGQVVLLSNPGGAGHTWVKARFKDAAPPLTVYADPATGLERVFIPANLHDNPHLPAEYRATLEQLPDAERAAYLDGNWDAFEGSVFRLVPGVHVWTWADFNARYGLPANNRKPPEGWRLYRVYDYGMAAPSACYWIALDTAPPAGTGRAIAYREDYTVAPDGKGGVKPNKGLNLPPRDAAKRLARLSEGESYAGSWAGRDLFDDPRADTGGGAALATHFQAEGVRFVAWKVGPGSRLAGKVALQQWLAPRADGAAGLVFIGEECPHALRTLPALEYAKNDPEQVDDSGEDHAFDALAGWAKMAPRPAVAPPPSGPKWLEAEMPGAGARIS